MNDEINWIKEQAVKLETESKSYEDRAFFNSLGQLSEELAIRIEQKQGELDGRIWNHKRW